MLKAGKLIAGMLAAVALVGAAEAARAAELLMFEEAGCGYCRRWNAEIGPGYPKSSEGRRAPLRRIDIRAPLPDDIMLQRKVTITPTFVLVENGREVGRLVGYAGADFFYEVLGEVMQRLPSAADASPAADNEKAWPSPPR